jgi:hypothetical protein
MVEEEISAEAKKVQLGGPHQQMAPLLGRLLEIGAVAVLDNRGQANRKNGSRDRYSRD